MKQLHAYTLLSRALKYSNAEELDFSDIADLKPTQEFDVAQGRDIGEYHVMFVTC